MKQSSLQLRLLTGAAVAIFAALVVAWLAMTWLFSRHVEQREAESLVRNALVLAAGLSTDSAGQLALSEEPSDPRFATPAGELYWQVSDTKTVLRSRSLWDQSLVRTTDAPERRWRTRTIASPYGGDLIVVERAVHVDPAPQPILIQVAADSRPLNVARREFAVELAGFLGVLWLVLSAAALMQVKLGLQPLSRIRTELSRMKRNPQARLAGDHPREITPLTEEINAMAEARQGDLERARRRAADLAHSLKTPLAALAAQTRLARDQGAAGAADGLEAAIAAMGATLEAELARARAAATREIGRQQHGFPARAVARVIDVLERTDDGARVVFAIEIADDLEIPAPDDVLTEILGALLENAARHAKGYVRVAAQQEGDAVTLRIEDDGSGIEDAMVEAAIVRGGRIDEAGPGHGLGLAIARDLVEATDGTIALGKSELGGLAIDLSWRA
jgi:signal transduction histidine kinase